MKKLLLVFALFIPCILLTKMDGKAQNSVKITLPNSTVVAIKTTHQIDAMKYKVGSTVMLVVAANVTVKNQILIAAGAPVIGVMDQAKEQGMVGKGGELALSLQSTQAVDGTTIALSGSIRARGEDEMGGTIAASVIICPLFLVNEGEAAIIPEGFQVRAFTVGDFKITPLTS